MLGTAPPEGKKSSRRLVVCCDGTQNEFGKINTNVVRLIQSLDRNPDCQRLYYDPGVGTLAEPGVLGKFKQRWSKFKGLAFGAGITWKVQEAYAYLVQMWQPGDQIFLFGFSRGAYTVRILAGLLHALGLLPAGGQNMVPYVMRLYQGLRDERKYPTGGKEWEKLCDDFRWTFARPMPGHEEDRHCPIQFLGLWDTVSSVGWVRNPETFPYTAKNPSIHIIRHAISIDERRWFFRQNQMRRAGPPQDLVQMWFSGVHSDIGGGYPRLFSNNPPKYSDLWRLSFDWMRGEAEKAGLLFNQARLNKIFDGVPEQAWEDPQHESLIGFWKGAEYLPKKVWNTELQQREWKRGHRKPRTVLPGALIHRSVLQRIQKKDLNYTPKNLSEAFRERVCALGTLPDSLVYQPD
jgi:uncharacterized protein (DUF2235 family)